MINSSSVNSNRLLISIGYLGNSADALNIQEAVQYFINDKIREALKNSLINAGSDLNSLIRLTELKRRIDRYSGNSTYNNVSPTSVASSKSDFFALETIFLNDGPKLGKNIEESKALLDELLSLGININATSITPVLITKQDKKGNVLEQSFKNMTQDERNSLNLFKRIASQSIADDIREKYGSADTDIYLTRYEIFDVFSNLQPAQDDLNLSKSFLAYSIENLNDKFSNQLTLAIKTGDKLNTIIQNQISDVKTQLTRVSASQEFLNQVVNEILQKLRQFRIDSEIRTKKNNESAIDKGSASFNYSAIPEILKSNPYRVESVSTIKNNSINVSSLPVKHDDQYTKKADILRFSPTKDDDFKFTSLDFPSIFDDLKIISDSKISEKPINKSSSEFVIEMSDNE